MGRLLPGLRRNLDLMPSPVEGRPGLLLRDPFRYTETMAVVPPALCPLLAFFDGQHEEEELKAALLRATGDLRALDLVAHLVNTLSEGGFLDDEVHAAQRAERHRAFAEAPRREPVHAGSGYPAEALTLKLTMDRYLDGGGEGKAPLAPAPLGIAAPHVSPEGGWRCYASAYRALPPAVASRTAVVLGTSHYGPPRRFGLTRKPFVTPLGEAAVDAAIVDELAAAGPAAVVEDYCHAVEHSIEFQVLFLQHVLGPAVRIVPVLCGPLPDEGLPEEDEGVRRFLDALAALAAREGSRLLWVLGVDLAHVGRRYGGARDVRAGEGEMREVEERDRERLARVTEGDARGFWELVRGEADALNWCGSAPLYAFLRSVRARGRLLRYEQWNIDPRSVVSFAALAFEAQGQDLPA